MLAPVTEAWPGEEELLELGVESVRALAGVRRASSPTAAGRPAGLRTEGTVVVATGSGDRAELDAPRRAPRPARAAGRAADRPRAAPAGARRSARTSAAGCPCPTTWPSTTGSCSPRCARPASGPGCVRREAPAAACSTTARASSACAATDGAECAAPTRRGGCRAPTRPALHPALHGLVRPVKGEILRLRAAARARSRRRARTVRALVDGRPVYLVPRDDGGSWSARPRRGRLRHRRSPSAASATCCATPSAMLPGIAEYALVESAAGLRPGSPDNLPLIGAARARTGLLVATGHGRNGILLAPVTADAVAALLRGEPVPGPVRAADPARFVPAAPRRCAWSSGSTASARELPTDARCGRRARRAGPAADGGRRRGRRRGRPDGAVGGDARSPTARRVEVLTAVQGG